MLEDREWLSPCPQTVQLLSVAPVTGQEAMLSLCPNIKHKAFLE